jgi:hypothetical protein
MSPGAGAGRLHVTAGGVPLPVEVRDTRLRLAASGRSPADFSLPPGRYVVRAELPGGASVEEFVEIGPGTHHDVTLDAAGALRAGRARPSSVVSRSDPLDPRIAAGWGAARPHLKTNVSFRGGPGERAPRGPESPAGADLYFRIVQALERSAVEADRPPEVTVLQWDGGTAELGIRARRAEVAFAQCCVPGGVPLTFGIPAAATGSAAECRMVLEVAGTEITATPRFGRADVDLALDFLRWADLRSAGTVLSAEEADALLYHKVKHPIAATVGGYVLLRLGSPESSRRSWAENLAEWFPWLPDGAAIAGEYAARAGDHQPAAALFMESIRRGLPIFTEGMSILVARLLEYVRQERSPVSGQDRTRLEEVLPRLLRMAPFVDQRSTLLAIRGLDPLNPDETQGPVAPEALAHGWTRVRDVPLPQADPRTPSA